MKSSEIKQIARNKLKGNWLKAYAITAIFVGITLALSYCSIFIQNVFTKTPILYYASQIIFTLLLLPLSFGFISAMTKLLDGKNPAYTTVINDALLNASKSIGIFFRTLLKMIIPCSIIPLACVGMLFLVTRVLPLNVDTLGGYLLLLFFLYVLAIIVIAIFALPYSLSVYALANDNKLSAKEAIEKSVTLMDGNKWNFVKLIISFLGWGILIGAIVVVLESYAPAILKELIESIGAFAILPYLISSIAVFFNEVNNVKVEVVDASKEDEANDNM